jgi:hypothetical protein
MGIQHFRGGGTNGDKFTVLTVHSIKLHSAQALVGCTGTLYTLNMYKMQLHNVAAQTMNLKTEQCVR